MGQGGEGEVDVGEELVEGVFGGVVARGGRDDGVEGKGCEECGSEGGEMAGLVVEVCGQGIVGCCEAEACVRAST